jgi:hypothetical protein
MPTLSNLPAWAKIAFLVFLIAVLGVCYVFVKPFLLKEAPQNLSAADLKALYSSNNSGDCERIVGGQYSRIRDACFLKAAMLSKDINLCYKIGGSVFGGNLGDVSMKQRCIEQLSPFDYNQSFVSAVIALKTPEACNQLSDWHYTYARDKCLYDIAVAKKDESICAGISSQKTKTACTQAVKKTG